MKVQALLGKALVLSEYWLTAILKTFALYLRDKWCGMHVFPFDTIHLVIRRIICFTYLNTSTKILLLGILPQKRGVLLVSIKQTQEICAWFWCVFLSSKRKYAPCPPFKAFMFWHCDGRETYVSLTTLTLVGFSGSWFRIHGRTQP